MPGTPWPGSYYDNNSTTIPLDPLGLRWISYIHTENVHCGNGFNGNCVPDISCMHMNIRSLPDKFDKLKVLLSSLELVNIRFDFILICETFLSDRNHDLYNLPGYTFVSRHRKYAKCGGVGIYVRSCFNYIVREDLSTFTEQSFESIFIEVAVCTGHCANWQNLPYSKY